MPKTTTNSSSNAFTFAGWARRRLTVEGRVNRSLAAFLVSQEPRTVAATDHQRPFHRHIQLTRVLSR